MTPALDPAILDDLRAIDDSIVVDLVKTFIEDVPQRIARIRECAASGDLDQLSREAHGLKGSALAVGATRLAALCVELEQHARSRDPEGFAAPSDALEAAFADVRARLLDIC